MFLIKWGVSSEVEVRLMIYPPPITNQECLSCNIYFKILIPYDHFIYLHITISNKLPRVKVSPLLSSFQTPPKLLNVLIHENKRVYKIEHKSSTPCKTISLHRRFLQYINPIIYRLEIFCSRKDPYLL